MSVPLIDGLSIGGPSENEGAAYRGLSIGGASENERAAYKRFCIGGPSENEGAAYRRFSIGGPSEWSPLVFLVQPSITIGSHISHLRR